MKELHFLVTAAISALILPTAGQSADLETGELRVGAGDTVQFYINDQPVNFRIAPDAVAAPTVNADTAERLGLKASMVRYEFRIGPEKILNRTDNVRYRTPSDSFRRRTAFSDRQVVEGAEAIAGPAAFPYERVVLVLREPQAGDRAISFALDTEMGRSQTGVLMTVGGHPIYAAFSFDRSESLVTATGGRWIADANRGWLSDGAREVPILYGVERPVRSLTLAEPLMLGDLEVRNLAVRVSDLGSSRGIATEAVPEADPNEIVITAESGRKIPNQRLLIGMDTIGHCASITYDFDASTVTLMCPAQSAEK